MNASAALSFLVPLSEGLTWGADALGIHASIVATLTVALSGLLLLGIVSKVTGWAARLAKGLEVLGWIAFWGALAAVGASWAYLAWGSEWGRGWRCWVAKVAVDRGVASWVLAAWVC